MLCYIIDYILREYILFVQLHVYQGSLTITHLNKGYGVLINTVLLCDIVDSLVLIDSFLTKDCSRSAMGKNAICSLSFVLSICC